MRRDLLVIIGVEDLMVAIEGVVAMVEVVADLEAEGKGDIK